jgi:hypothetical protein
MLFRKIVSVYSEIHTKDINTIRKKSAGFFNVEPDDTYSNQCAPKNKT